jgi:arylsulfatase A-like enzyme
MAEFRRTLFPALGVLLLSGCARTPAPASAPVTRLVDVFDAKQVAGTASAPAAPVPRTEWRFDGPPPPAPTPPPGGALAPAGPPGSVPAPSPFAATRGWEAGPGVSGLAIHEGKLVGKTTTDFPVLRLERTTGLDNPDQVHAIEVRLRVSGGSTLSVQTRPAATIDLKQEAGMAQAVPWTITTPVVAGSDIQTYTMRPAAPVSGGRIRHLLIRPTDAAGADFAIESVRMVFRREYLTSIKSGVSWQGLRDVFRETIVTRAPETVSFKVRVPARPVLDLAVGSPEDSPVTFRVSLEGSAGATSVLSHTVTTAHRWERRVVDLQRFAGQTVTLSLATEAAKSGAIAFWGAPALRERVDAGPGQRPQTVILIQGDTLRTDHLDLFGYERKTAPTLRRLAGEGALFRNAVTQTSWTKAATPSVHTSLYPSTHGVHKIPDRLPSSAATVAEAYREAGYATVSFSSVAFTGAFTNLHQGFEELHEAESTVGRAGPKGAKTAREYVDRLVDWLDDHRDVPSFVFLHVFDPHSPYEPNRPFDTTWADPKGRDEYVRQQEALKKVVKDPFMAVRGMATPEEMRQAGIDPEFYLRYSKDWYDGSILGMDTELGRLVERLGELSLRDRSLIAFYADHGEEFHEHGRMFHGETVYGEMIRVPLILWAPGRVPAGLDVQEPVQLIDVMPTLLELSGLQVPKVAQGQSLRPLLVKPGGAGAVSAESGWRRRPLVAERQPMGGTEHPRADESYAIMDGGFKLVHNVLRPPEKPEFELFDFMADPHDRKNIAAEQKETVARLSRELEAWKKMAKAARLPPDSETTKGMSAEQLEQLRSLGYVK